METATAEQQGNVRKLPEGRKDGNKQAAVPDRDKLDKGMSNIVDLMKKAQFANNELSDGVKALAEKSGFLASVVRKLGRAKVKDNVADAKREIEQMSFAFGVDSE